MKRELIGSTLVHALVALFLFVISARSSALPPPIGPEDVMNVTPVDALPAQFAPKAEVPAPAEDADVKPEVAVPEREPEAVPIEPKKPEEKPKPKPKTPAKKPEPTKTEKPKETEAKPAEGGVYESKVHSGAAGKPGGSLLGLPGGTPGGRPATYPDRVANKVYYMWKNPAKLPEPVTCSVVFRITADGKASQIALDRSSGMPAFDNSAVRAVYEAAPYPPFPRSMDDQYIIMRIIFEYTP